MQFSKSADSMPWGRQRGSVDMRMPGPIDLSSYYMGRPSTTPSFVAGRPRDKIPGFAANTGKSMFAAPWKGSVIKPALRERLMYYSPKNMIARSPLVRNMPNSEQAADLRRFYATDEYERLSALAKPGTGTWRYGGPVERMVVNPGHVDGTPHVGVGVFGGQGMRDQVVGSLGLAASALMPGAANVHGPLRGRALGGFFKKLVGKGIVADNVIDAYSSFADAAKEVGTTPAGAISRVSGAVDALPSIDVNVEAPKLKRGLSALAVGQALRAKEKGAVGTALQSIAMPAVVGTELVKKWFDNTGRRLVVDSLKPTKLPAGLIRELQTSGSDARGVADRIAGDIRRKDYSSLADTLRRERHAVSGLSEKYLPRDNGPMLQKGRDVYATLKKRGLKVNGSALLDDANRYRNAVPSLSDKYFQRDGGIHER